ncbi:MAG: methyltransferase domain-containing protein [Armatimonadota bacterium]
MIAPPVVDDVHAAIRRELLGLLTCPETGEDLTGWDGVSAEGRLVTASGRSYAVEDGIPNLLPDALRFPAPEAPEDAVLEKQHEMEARDAQVGDYDRMVGLKVFTSVELPLTLRFLAPEPDHLMLEGGCGTGRMTPAFLERVRGLVCVDFSGASLRVARAKLPESVRGKVLFLQADLSQLPLRSNAFDRVGSFGVYEHIPTPETRAGALRHLARVCKPRTSGGRFGLSAYRWGPPQSWSNQKEGHHGGGIYFYRFTAKELRADLEACFDVGGATETLLYYHLMWGRRKTDG